MPGLTARTPLGMLAVAVALISASSAAGEDVPYVATPDETVAAMLTMARVGPGDEVIDLGSGDGRIVISAVKDFGASHGLGVEISPRLVAGARAAAARAGIADRVEFREQNLFDTDFGAATVVTMYLLPDLNLRLRPKVLAMRPGTRIVSHEFDMGDWTPDASRTVLGDDHPRGPSVVHLWIVPANVDGAWAWNEDGRPAGMILGQQYQRIAVRLADGRAVTDATLTGDRIRVVARPRSAVSAEAEVIYEGRIMGDSIDGTRGVPGAPSAPWQATRTPSRR